MIIFNPKYGSGLFPILYQKRLLAVKERVNKILAILINKILFGKFHLLVRLWTAGFQPGIQSF